MPSLSGPNPMSIGQYQAQENAAGIGQATTGASGLAAVLGQGPQQQMYSAYMGAETGQRVAQTQQLQQTAAKRQEFVNIMSNPAAVANPAMVQRAFALVATDPNLAAQAPTVIASALQLAHAYGQQGAPSGSAADAFSAGAGVTPMASTPSGYQAGLTNQIRQSQIGAGATIGAANIAANASMTNERTREAGLDRRTLVTTEGPNGPQYTPAISAGGQPAYDSARAIAGDKPTAVMTQAGPRIVPERQATSQGMPPVMGTDQVSGIVLGQGTNVYPPQGSAAAAFRGAPGPTTPSGTGVLSPGDGVSSVAAPGGAGTPGTESPDTATTTTGGPPPVPAPAAGNVNMNNVIAGHPTNAAEALMMKSLNIQPGGKEAIDPKNTIDAKLNMEMTRAFVTPDMQTTGFPVPLTREAGQDAHVYVPADVRNLVLDRYNQYLEGRATDPNGRLMRLDLRNNADDAMRQAVQDVKPMLDFNHGHSLLPSSPGASVSFKQLPQGVVPPAAAGARVGLPLARPDTAPPGLTPPGAPPAAPPGAPQGAAPGAQAPQVQANGQPPGQQGPTPQAIQAANANPQAAVAEARAVIARNPAFAPIVVARLRAAGIPVPPDLVPGPQTAQAGPQVPTQ